MNDCKGNRPRLSTIHTPNARVMRPRLDPSSVIRVAPEINEPQLAKHIDRQACSELTASTSACGTSFGMHQQILLHPPRAQHNTMRAAKLSMPVRGCLMLGVSSKARPQHSVPLVMCCLCIR